MPSIRRVRGETGFDHIGAVLDIAEDLRKHESKIREKQEELDEIDMNGEVPSHPVVMDLLNEAYALSGQPDADYDRIRMSAVVACARRISTGIPKHNAPEDEVADCTGDFVYEIVDEYEDSPILVLVRLTIRSLGLFYDMPMPRHIADQLLAG